MKIYIILILCLNLFLIIDQKKSHADYGINVSDTNFTITNMTLLQSIEKLKNTYGIELNIRGHAPETYYITSEFKCTTVLQAINKLLDIAEIKNFSVTTNKKSQEITIWILRQDEKSSKTNITKNARETVSTQNSGKVIVKSSDNFEGEQYFDIENTNASQKLSFEQIQLLESESAKIEQDYKISDIPLSNEQIFRLNKSNENIVDSGALNKQQIKELNKIENGLMIEDAPLTVDQLNKLDKVYEIHTF